MSFDPRWRLIDKHLNLEPIQHTFLINPPQRLPLGESPLWSIYQHSDYQAKHHQQALELHLDSQIEQSILFLPKEKALAQFFMAQLAGQLPVNHPVYLVGENTSGIKSVHKQVWPGYAPLQKVASGFHCQLWRTYLQEQQAFHLEQYISHTNLSVLGHTLATYFLPGVFGAGKLDQGTEFLLQHLPSDIQGSVLDFGCGNGIIGRWLSQHYPIEQLSCSDLNLLALACTKKNLTQDHIQASYFASDGLSQVPGKYDWIVSNPPFHQGLQQDYAITETFIVQAKQHLKPQGKLLLVYNSFLPWPSLLDKHFIYKKHLANNRKFQITLAMNP